MLAGRQQYKEAADVFHDIAPVPGYFTRFLQRGQTLLQHAENGEPLLGNDLAAVVQNQAPPPLQRWPISTREMVSDLRGLTYGNRTDPEAKQQALALATILAAIFPPEATFADQEVVLKAFAKFGGQEQIAEIAARAREYPNSAEAQLALGEALELSTPPQASSGSADAYRRAFRLAPDRPDIAEKITGPAFSTREQQDGYCVLLRHNANRSGSRLPRVVDLFKEPDALARAVKAYGEGCERGGRGQIVGDANFSECVAACRQAGLDEALIAMLTSVTQTSPPETGASGEPERLLWQLLAAHGRTAEFAPVVDRVLFPSEFLYGLDLAEGPPAPLFYPAQVLDLVRKFSAAERIRLFESHAREIMQRRLGDTRAPLVLLTLLIMDDSPSLSADLPVCLAALHGDPEDLLTLAKMAASAPETQFAAADMLAEVRRSGAGQPGDFTTEEVEAATELDLGDREHAQTKLRELLAAAKAPQDVNKAHPWNVTLELMARCGMEAEAAELFDLLFGHAAHADSSLVLAYMEACLRYGRPQLARRALPDFERLLAANVSNSNPLGIKIELDQKFLRRMVEIYITLDRPEEAAKTLQMLLGSSQAAATPQMRQDIESAQALLAKATGASGALPVAIVEGEKEGQLTVWWNLAALTASSNPSTGTQVTVFDADVKSLTGKYSAEILAGDTPDHLTRLAVIPHAPNRGEWQGKPELDLAAIRFTRVILTGPDGATVIGPSLPMVLGEELLIDPDMTEAVKARTSSAQWLLPEGALSTTAGPVPGRPALAFVYKGIEAGCEIRGQRVPIHPGECFIQSAWLRDGEASSWGVRCFDAQGKELAHPSRVEVATPADAAGWTFVEQRLEPAGGSPRNSRLGARRLLPAGTAFIEPVLRFGTNAITWQAKPPVRWAGLSLRRVAPDDDQPETPQRTTEQLGPIDPFEPAGAPTKVNSPHDETLFAEFAQPACQVAVSPESDMIVVGCNDGTLHFLAYPSAAEIAAVHAHDEPITSLAVLSRKAGVYSVDTRGDTHLVSLNPTKDELVACTAHQPVGTAIAPARKWVVFASSERFEGHPQMKVRIEVVDLTTGKQVRLLEEPGLLNQLLLSPDEKQFSIRQPEAVATRVVSWELPSFNKLPDRNENVGLIIGGDGRPPLSVSDPSRHRYVTVGNGERFVVKTINNEVLWAFDPAPGATSLAVMPKDGVIFLCKGDGRVWKCVSPK